MRTALSILLFLSFITVAAASAQASSQWPTPPAAEAASPQVSGPLQGGTADHTKFEQLK